jgi:hypothetical protein
MYGAERESASFTEEQRFRQPWLWLTAVVPILLGGGLLGWSLYSQLARGEPFGDQAVSDGVLIAIAIPTLLVMVGILWLLYAARLETLVRSDGLAVRFFPGRWRLFPYTEMGPIEAVEVRPVRDYGGWGVRMKRGERAYLVSGTRGIRFGLADGKRIMIGSQQPEALLAAIRTWKR